MDVVNIILGAYAQKDGIDVSDRISGMLRGELEKVGQKVGLLDVVPSKEMVLEKVKSNKYDVIICQEELNGASIGAGTVREWMNENAKIRSILLVDRAKKGGRKLQNLFDRSYYDALYADEFNGECVSKLILSSRSREDAIIYYGLEEHKSSEEMPVRTNEEVNKDNAESNATLVAEENVSQTDAFVEQEKDVSVKTEYSRESIEAEIDKKMREMESTFFKQDSENKRDENAQNAKVVNFEKTSVGMGAVVSGEDEAVSDLMNEGSIMGDIFENTKSNHTPEDDITQELIMESFTEPELVMEEKYDSISLSLVGGTNVITLPKQFRESVEVIHLKGTVVEIMDEHLMMLFFDSPLGFDSDEVFRLFDATILVHFDKKGHMENGKFKNGTLTARAYGNCMVDKYAAIVETEFTNLYELVESIKGKRCNVILKRKLGV